MQRTSILRSILVAAVAAVFALIGSAAAQASVPALHHTPTAVGTAAAGQGVTAADLETTAGQPEALGPPAGGWSVPSDRSYHLTASCQPYAAAIAQGAAAWQGLDQTASSGTPVECRNSYITDCGGGSGIVGCNWNQGARIALYMGGVSDQALLAAHEFGHDWYAHSSYQCAGWGSPAEVMAPTMCGYGLGQEHVRID